ncbi:hypothetical protein ALC62_11435, partial [Cyphomyrmex costatus]
KNLRDMRRITTVYQPHPRTVVPLCYLLIFVYILHTVKHATTKAGCQEREREREGGRRGEGERIPEYAITRYIRSLRHLYYTPRLYVTLVNVYR